MNEIESRAPEFMHQKKWSLAVPLLGQLLDSNHSDDTPGLKEVLQDLDTRLDSLLASDEGDLEIHRHLVESLHSNEELPQGANKLSSAQKHTERKELSTNHLTSGRHLEAVDSQLILGAKVVSGGSNMMEVGEKSQVSNFSIMHSPPRENVVGSKILPEDSSVSFKHDCEITSVPSKIVDSASLKGVTADQKTLEEDLKSSQMSKSEHVNGCNDDFKFVCIYCAVSFKCQSALRMHCQTEAHQTVIMSDEGKDWKWRPPPRGLTSDAYSLCENWEKNCRYGNQCVEAHCPEELQEWCERFEYRKMKLQRAKEKELYGKSFTEQLLERWSQAHAPELVLAKVVDYVEVHISDDLSTSVVSKESRKSWKFALKTCKLLQAVALLEDAYRNHFSIKSIETTVNELVFQWTPTNPQEWLLPEKSTLELHVKLAKEEIKLCHTVTVEFSTDIFGTFRQSVVFGFGCDPLLIKHFCVDVLPAANADKIDELKKELYSTERWDENNVEIIKFSPREASCLPVLDEEKEQELLRMYPTPTPSTFMLTQSTIKEKKLTKYNYQSRMHELLCVEEMARYQQIARYNIRTTLTIASSYLLSSSGPTASTAKYAHDGQLYAVMHFGKAISEDTAAGRLVLNSCTTVLLSASETNSSKGTGKSVTKKKDSDCHGEKRKVYEAIIEDKGKNVIYLKLSSETVKMYKMKAGMDFHADIQFQLNRIQYCEWHSAVDKIQDYKILFPETYLEPSIPWSPLRQWKDIPDTKLNVKQKEAIMAITTPSSVALPPILIIGPFGTGKTYTLAQAIKQLLMIQDSRILVCTHSNSAADIYIHDYLHPYVQDGNECARPLRIYYHKRWVSTVNPIVQKYCLIRTEQGAKHFKIPTAEDVEKHRVVVVTLSNSSVLASLGMRKDFFTHIFLDEAAQAMECEAIMPLALASEKTRIVLAGDHMQLSPELFSPFAKERNLHLSLLERLYDHYPSSFPCKILLCENYRAHEAIIKFTSELFYDQKLVCSGKQPSHDQFYPLTFFTSRGEDVQDTNSTAFYNNAEVYEVVERVMELRGCWPTSWGKLDGQSIGIMTPYADQVFRIRSELRRRKLSGISVERVLNVQGKQFRAIFLSTVRTRHTCSSQMKGQSSEESDYGFLSNSKLLNTAITRAQSLVAVVGDPIALCSIGRCRKVWERFIQTCHENGSLFGIQWSAIRAHLDGVEFKKTYGLNPLAPEFVPRIRNTHSKLPFNPPVLNSSGIALVLGPNGPQPAILLEGFQTQFNHLPLQPSLWSGPPLQYQQLPGFWPAPVPQNVGNFHSIAQPAQGTHIKPFQGTHQQHSVWPGVIAGQQFHITSPLVNMTPQTGSNPIAVPSTEIQSCLYGNLQPGPVQVHPAMLRAAEPLGNWPAAIPAPVSLSTTGFAPLPATGGLPSHLSNGVTVIANSSTNVNDVTRNAPSQMVVPGSVEVTNMNLMSNNVVGGQMNTNVILSPLQPKSSLTPASSFLPGAHLPSKSLECQVQTGELKDQVFPLLSPKLSHPWSSQLSIQEQQHLFQQQQQQQQMLLQQQALLQQLELKKLQQKKYEEEQYQLKEQQRLNEQQQLHQKALMKEQRKSLLGRILTPVVRNNPEWHRLIPGGVNLLNLVDLPSQQEQWYNHLLKLGEVDTAKQFAQFMVLCNETIVAAMSESSVLPSVPRDNIAMKTQLDQNLSLKDTAIKAPSSSSISGSIHTSGPTTVLKKPVECREKESALERAKEPVIMMRDLDPQYMLGGDLSLGGNSVWAVKADQLQHSILDTKRSLDIITQNLSVPKQTNERQKLKLPEMTPANLSDSDDSGDELLSSINRQLNLEQLS